MSTLDMDAFESVSLADLADITLDDYEEVTFESLPAGVYIFEGLDLEVKKVGDEDTPVLDIKLSVIEAVEILNLPEGKTEESYAGKTHRESFFFKDGDAIGRFRTFVKQVGLDNTGKLIDVANSIVGTRFKSRVVHSKNKNDPERPYVNLRPVKADAPAA